MSLKVTPGVILKPEQTYSGTITWTGTTAPSGSTNHTYQWIQFGKIIVARFNLIYGVGGSALSQVEFDLPGDVPAPVVPGGMSGNNNVVIYGSGSLNTALTTPSSSNLKSYLRINSTSTGYIVGVISNTAAGVTDAYATLVYQAA